jgi:membrane-associated phospholipid phosphatase
LHTSEALILSGAETYVLKGLAGRDRPLLNPNDATRFRFGGGFGSGGHNSMPSGHTSAAFAAVAAINSEIEGWWPHGSGYIGPLLYAGAGLVGVARVYGSKHWASDVIVGALVGTSAGVKVVRYNHAHPNNRIDRWLGAVSLSSSPVHPRTWVVRVGS